MKLTDRYIIRQILPPMLLAFAVISFVSVCSEIQDRAFQFAYFITLRDTLTLMILFIPLLVSLVIPMTFLMGFLMTFGRMAQQHEIVSMQAAGLSLKRVAAPVIVFGAMLGAVCFVVQDQVQPWAVTQAFNLIYRDIPARITVDRLPPGTMHEYEGWRVYYARRSDDGRALLDLDLVRPGNGDSGTAFFHAASATVIPAEDAFQLVLTDGHIVTEDRMHVDFGEHRVRLPKPSALRPSNERKMLDFAGLLRSEAAFEKEFVEHPDKRREEALVKERREIAERISLPFAALSCALVGAPIGARARHRGRSYAFAAGITIALGYGLLYVMVETDELLSLAGFIARTSIPNLILIGIGAVLWWQSDRIPR